MRVGLIGAGAMGAPVGRRLLAAGHALSVFNRRPQRASGLVAAGARVAPTPAAAARDADVVLTVVSDAAALREVIVGPDGAGEALEPGAILVDLSTVGPGAARALRELVTDGVDVLDAPMLGSREQAAAGTLELLVGGEAAHLDRCRAVLEVLGTVTHVGPAGAGAGAKLVANLALLGSLAALAECAALADALDLDTSTLQAVLGRTPLAEQAVKRRTALAGEPGSPRFVLRHAHKDAALAEQALVLAGREAPVATGTRQRLAAALAAGLGDEDYTAMLTPACWRT